MNEFEDLTIDQIYDKIDENDEKLDDYKYSGWLYWFFFAKEIKKINQENTVLHSLAVKKMNNLV